MRHGVYTTSRHLWSFFSYHSVYSMNIIIMALVLMPTTYAQLSGTHQDHYGDNNMLK